MNKEDIFFEKIEQICVETEKLREQIKKFVTFCYAFEVEKMGDDPQLGTAFHFEIHNGLHASIHGLLGGSSNLKDFKKIEHLKENLVIIAKMLKEISRLRDKVRKNYFFNIVCEVGNFSTTFLEESIKEALSSIENKH